MRVGGYAVLEERERIVFGGAESELEASCCDGESVKRFNWVLITSNAAAYTEGRSRKWCTSLCRPHRQRQRANCYQQPTELRQSSKGPRRGPRISIALCFVNVATKERRNQVAVQTSPKRDDVVQVGATWSRGLISAHLEQQALASATSADCNRAGHAYTANDLHRPVLSLHPQHNTTHISVRHGTRHILGVSPKVHHLGLAPQARHSVGSGHRQLRPSDCGMQRLWRTGETGRTCNPKGKC